MKLYVLQKVSTGQYVAFREEFGPDPEGSWTLDIEKAKQMDKSTAILNAYARSVSGVHPIDSGEFKLIEYRARN